MNAPGSLSGSVLQGRYALGEVFQRSASGAIYAAKDVTSGRDVLVEVLSGLRAKSHEALRLFASAVARAGAVTHASIVVTLDCGLTHDGQPFVVEERDVGEPLRERIRRGALPMADTVDVVGQLLAALDAAHAKGALHLDLCSDRLLLTSLPGKPPRIKLRGLAVTSALLATHRAGVIDWVSTPTWSSTAYFSPERVTTGQNALDVHADLWASAVIAYEVLTGLLPFDAQATDALNAQIVGHWPPPPSARLPNVPTQLDPVLFRALHKTQSARFQSAAELRKALLGAWAAYRVAGLGAVEQRAKELTGHGATSHTSPTLTAPTLKRQFSDEESPSEKMFATPIYRVPDMPEDHTPTSQKIRVVPFPTPKGPK